MAAGTDDAIDADSAGVYFITVEEFESRSEPKADRKTGPAEAAESGILSQKPVDEQHVSEIAK